MEFATFLPSDCPPASAVPVSGELFCFVKSQPLTAEHFIPYLVEKGPAAFAEKKRCQAAGLSVLISESDVKVAIGISPYLRKRLVVKAKVEASWGKIEETPGMWPGHHTWWVPNGKQPETIFEVVKVA